MPKIYVDEVTTKRLFDIKTNAGATLYSDVELVRSDTPIVVGSTFGAVDANGINERITAQALPISNNRIAIDELMAYTGVTSQVSQTDSIFYDFPASTKQLTSGIIDLTKAYCAIVTTGTATVTVDSMNVGVIADFKVGQEVTLQDDSGKEVLTILTVGASSLTFTTNIVGTYSTGANVYRSNLKVNGDYYDFGGYSAQEVIDLTTPVQVVNSALTTSANARPVRTDSGILISVAFNPTGSLIEFYRSIDNGNTWILVATKNVATAGQHSIVVDGEIIKCITTSSTSAIVYTEFNAQTITPVQVLSALVALDTGQTVMNGCSLTIAPNGDLHAAWSSKNATSPNSFNIRYSKSTDGGVTWATPTQLTTTNIVDYNNITPSIIVNSTGEAGVVYIYATTAGFSVRVRSFVSGTPDSIKIIYDGTTYAQSSPSADVLSDGTIIVAWHGKDVSSSWDNIRFSQSTDNGVTWSAMLKLTSTVGGATYQQYPSITRDSNDNIYVVWSGLDNALNTIRLIKRTSGVWGSIEEISDNTTSNVAFPSTCNNFREFEKPLLIYKDFQDSDVKFYGKWTVGVELPLDEVDVRLNGESFENIDSMASWLYSNNLTGATVDASLSIHANGANEAYTDLADVEIDIDASNNYYFATGTVTTPNTDYTLKYGLTKSLPTDDMRVLRIQGGTA